MKFSYINAIMLIGIIIFGIIFVISISKSVQSSIANYYFGANQQILELNQVKNFEIASDPNQKQITIRGLIMHSALSAEKIYVHEENNIISVRIALVLANNQNSGAFEYALPLPKENQRIVFGNEKTQVWPL